MVAIPPSLPNLPNLSFGPFELHPASGELRKSGILIKLQPQPFRLLLLLAERSGTVVTREEIQRCLWTESTFVDFDHGINFSINQIRGALADDADKPRFVETLPRRGYRFIAPVQVSSNGHNAAGIAASNLQPALPKNGNLGLLTPREVQPKSVLQIHPVPRTSENDTHRKLHPTWTQLAGAGVLLLIASAAFWFVTRSPASRNPPLELKLRQLTTNPPENPVSNGAISPDGKYLAYTDTDGMHVRLIQTGETRIVPQPDSLNGKNVEWRILPQWFPDGTRFLADAHPPGQSPAFWSSEGSSIWMVSLLGGPPRKLRDDAIAHSISPDGSAIAFGANKGRLGDREIWLMGPNGEQARKLYDTDENSTISGLRWFPNGQRVWYSSNSSADMAGASFLARDLSGGPVTSISSRSEFNKSWEHTLLPDGRMLYQVPEPGTTGQSCNYWELPLNERTGMATNRPKRLTNWGGFCPISTSVTADSQKLAFLTWIGHTSIYIADSESNFVPVTNQRRFGSSESYDTPLDWTADSKEIIFSSNRDGHIGIFRQSLNGDTAERLVTGSYDWADAQISPDGLSLLYTAGRQEESWAPMKITRISLTGGSSEMILTARPLSEFRCAKSPANICVLSERSEDRKQFIFTAFDPLQGRGAELARVDIHSEAKKLHWDLSPDGTRLSFTRTPNDPIEILSLNTNTTETIHVKGWDNLESLDWTADGTGFFIAGGVHGGMVLLHVDLQGKATVLLRNRGDAAVFAIPSPDGRHLAIQDMRIDGNIWTLENF
jgi:Tol biopolymer transport system component/DNA-binding winged helix-turn-helix (wHTH) protein